jgi:hypothetical protein
MVEFALVLPLLMVVIFITIAASLIYAVRLEEHKAAYDAARHVAKYYKARLSDNAPADLVSGCYGSGNAITDFGVVAEAQRVLDYHYQHSPLMRSLATQPAVDFVSAGPPLNGNTYYCNSAMSVTISYDISIPGWSLMESLYNTSTNKHLVEIGVASRLARDY